MPRSITIAVRRFSPRSALVLAVAVVAAGVTAGTVAAAKASPLKITAPGRALQGKVAVVSVKSKSYSCKLSVR